MSIDEHDTPRAPALHFDVNKIEPLGAHWAMIDREQSEHPYFWTTYASGHWVFTDPVAIREAFSSPDLFSSISEVAAEPNPSYTWIPSNVDPPEHVKWRHVMNSWFAPDAIERLAPDATRICADLVDGLVERGGCEFMTEFASVYPSTVFLHSLGLPEEDTGLFTGWVRDIFDNLRHPDLKPRLEVAMGQVRAYWTDLIADRRATQRDPASDFVTHLMQSTVDGRSVTDDEILNISVVIMMAGIETTTGQLGYMFEFLATHPEHRRRLIDEPEIIPAAVEEFLRVHPIVMPGRKVTRDEEFHGCPMHAGDMVMLPLPAANRSPLMFDDPDQVDFDRSPNRHISFGAGVHRCLGTHLARRELITALTVWHDRIPDYELDGDPELFERGGTLSPVSVPLVWGSGG